MKHANKYIKKKYKGVLQSTKLFYEKQNMDTIHVSALY
jgi:hypothetical protein